MTEIRETIDVPLPSSVTETNVLRYFENQRSADGAVTIPLRVPLRDFGLPDALAIERDVAVHAGKRRDAENLNDEIGITWEPADQGPYPVFAGRIIVWSEGNPNESFIQLDGSYEPPLGAAGELFDAAIGHLIAERTARTFLNDLRDAAISIEQLPAKR